MKRGVVNALPVYRPALGSDRGYRWGCNQKPNFRNAPIYAGSSLWFNSRQPPIMKPQPFSVGVFSCPIAPTPACSRGFLRKPADFGIRPMAPSRATFLSLRAVIADHILVVCRFAASLRLSKIAPGDFVSPASLPETGTKSAKATTRHRTDQWVTRGRIKRFDCSIGRHRKP